MNNTLKFILVVGSTLGLILFGACAPPPKPAAGAGAAIVHVNAVEAAKLLAEKKVVVLDLRTPEEYATGRVAGARNLDCQAPDFATRVAQLDKSRTYLIYCRSGNRSTRALPVFQQQQVPSVVHLDGGVIAWQRAGKPLEK